MTAAFVEVQQRRSLLPSMRWSRGALGHGPSDTDCVVLRLGAAGRDPAVVVWQPHLDRGLAIRLPLLPALSRVDRYVQGNPRMRSGTGHGPRSIAQPVDVTTAKTLKTAKPDHPAIHWVAGKVAFYSQAGAGHFECLALAPSEDAGRPGSGNFDTNIMYVTGPITSAVVDRRAVVLKGSATVTGAGAGSDRPFTATVTRGGPGATLVLEASGLTFREILLEGRFNF